MKNGRIISGRKCLPFDILERNRRVTASQEYRGERRGKLELRKLEICFARGLKARLAGGKHSKTRNRRKQNNNAAMEI